MARIRTIKPEYWTSEQVMELSVPARLLFIGLWNFCDDHGRMAVSAKRIKAQIYPSDDFTAADIHGMLTELSVSGLVRFYDVDNKQFLEVTGWRHQNINRRGKPMTPLPPWAQTVPDQGSLTEGSLPEKEREKEREKDNTRRGSDGAPSPAGAGARTREGGPNPAGAAAGDEDDAEAAGADALPADTPADVQPGQNVPSRALGEDSNPSTAGKAVAPAAIEHNHATYDRVLARICEAVPHAPQSPAIGPIVRLIAQGFDLEDEIIPACLDALSGKRRIYSWEIVAERVEERVVRQRVARQRDGISAKPKRDDGPKVTIPGAGDYSETFLRDCVKRWRQDPSSWFPFLGPKPNEPGCHVPRRLIESARKAA
ncbi:hypothetical protein [Methylobacterium nodulans]|uniref:Uncharacterized protein n=1 Tax=Methylobacterium nodulans (strain LMG 21967 / CNCM I-2342 / ORS 2060) TaxID=460265 RepID=B8IIT6_METNO|nr:hypothetical protein [Methylobacterium nodulans]ACL61731.1 conserved hypothetical protein [Methylobacterium nodulans ORS 2060]